MENMPQCVTYKGSKRSQTLLECSRMYSRLHARNFFRIYLKETSAVWLRNGQAILYKYLNLLSLFAFIFLERILRNC